MSPIAAELPAGRDARSPAEALLAGKKVAADAINLLMQDHREAEGLFAAFSRSRDEAEKRRIAEHLCLALRAHMRIEEELFYPHARELTGDDGLVDHAVEEHAEAKALIDQIEQAQGSAANFDLLVARLEQSVAQHVAEEETEFFPKVRAAGLEPYVVGRAAAGLRSRAFSDLTGKPLPPSPEAEAALMEAVKGRA